MIHTVKFKIKHFSLFITAILAAITLLSCKAKVVDRSDRVNVICSIFPLYDWAHSIIGDYDNETTLSLLVKSGVDLHSFQPSTTDIVHISTCDIFVYVGGESDAWVSDVLKNSTNPNQKVLNLMDILKDYVKEEEIVEGMQAEAEEPENDEHVWLSIKNAKIVCQEFTKVLCELAPASATTYQQNLADYLEQLDGVDLSYKSVIAAAPNKTIIVCDRFPFRYLVDDYGIKYYAAFSGCEAETEASFETVAFLANKLKEEKLSAVLILDRSNKKIARTVIANAKLPHTDIFELDSMQSTALRDAFDGKTYISTMQTNLETLQKALK